MRQLLAGGHVYTPDAAGEALPPVRDVLIEGGAIAALDPPADRVGDAVRLDLRGHLLLPGFVNAHYHSHDVLAKGRFEAMPLEHWGIVAGGIGSGRSVEEVRLRTLTGAVECLRNGITTVQDFANLNPLDDGLVDAVVDAYATAGLRVVLSLAVRDLPQIETLPWGREVVPAELYDVVGDVRNDANRQLAFVERQIERVGDRGGMVVWALSASAPQRCSPALLEGLAALAERLDLPIYTHVYETRAQRVHAARAYREHGGSLIAMMEAVGLLGPRTTIAHGVWPDAAELDRLAASGTGVVLNMLSNLRLRSGVAPIAAYRHRGVPLSLGCDNCSCSDVQSMFQVMKLYALLGGLMAPGEPAPTAAEALDLATRGGARSARQDHRLGTLEVGKRADLLALDLADPAYRPLNDVTRQVVFAESGRGLRHVWVDGVQVVADSRTTRVGEGDLATALAAVMPKVRADLDRHVERAEAVLPALQEIWRRAGAFDLGYDRWLAGRQD